MCISVGTFSLKTSVQSQDSNNADVLTLCSKLLDYILLKSGSFSGLYFYLSKGVNTKDITYLNVHYACMLHCMIKLRPDLESTH